MSTLPLALLPLALVLAFSATAQEDGSAENERYIRMLSDPSPQVRIQGAKELGDRDINATRKGAASLEPLLDDKEKSVRLQTIRSLEKIGQEAKSATPRLVEMLNDRDPEISNAAARALNEIGSVKGKEAAQAYERKRAEQSRRNK